MEPRDQVQIGPVEVLGDEVVVASEVAGTLRVETPEEEYFQRYDERDRAIEAALRQLAADPYAGIYRYLARLVDSPEPVALDQAQAWLASRLEQWARAPAVSGDDARSQAFNEAQSQVRIALGLGQEVLQALREGAGDLARALLSQLNDGLLLARDLMLQARPDQPPA